VGKAILKLSSFILLVSLCPNKASWKSLLLVEGRHINYQCWFVLKDFLHTLYAPHLYSSETDYKEPEVVDEPEPKLLMNQKQKLLMSQIQSL